MRLVRLIAVALDQHHRHVRHLAHGTLAAGPGRFRWVETLVFAAQQFPQKGQQRGLAGARFTGDLEERKRLVLRADLLGKQRPKPERQGNDALGSKAQPQHRQPVAAVHLAVALNVHGNRLLQRLEPQLAELEKVLLVHLADDAVTHGNVAEHVAAVLFAVANEIDGLHGFQGEELVLHDLVELLATAGEHGAGGHAEQAFLEFAGGSDLATGERVFDAAAVVREIDAEVVPGFVGDFVALEVQGLRVAVRDFDHAAALAQGLLTALLFIEQLVFVAGGCLQRQHRLVEFLQVHLEPVQAAVETEVKFMALAPVVHQHAFLSCAFSDQ
ncbi:hypothetical protein D3C87_1264920 [compost metagenome]